ncbi:immunoglobulin-like domain-containing protein, partial [uncultured Clostridium sp.]|uniref:immunoglobulin-like domain-containing protein n=1 Tax=uncultured Clostridium sp. TaxID=59620 RepID=UPI0026722B27
LNNVPYEIGDYIYVYHKESQSKLYMNGVTNQGNENYSNGVQFKPKTERRFKITNSGLEIVTNTAPTLNVTGFENESENLKKTIKRGDTINLIENVTYSDEFDSQNNIPLTLLTSEFNNMKLGEQTVIYSVSDSWGATTTKEVKVKVEPKNDLEQVKFKFYSKGSTDELFNITIDSVNHKIEVNRVSNNNQAIKGYSGAAFKIKIIDGVSKKVKREIAIRGNETGFSSTLDRLDGYSYNDGDRISVWALNSEDIKIDGDSKIEAKPNNVSYLNGISDRDHIDNVRFEMTGDKLKYIHNNEPQFKFTGDLSVVRGEELNVTSGVSINDDHDGEVKDLSTVKVINFDKYKLGEQTVTYQYTDSWGRTGTAPRKVTVLPKNKLEQNYVKFYTDNTNDSILKISFDDITGKLKFEDATTGTINGINEEVIRIRTYRDGKKVRDLPIKGNASGIQIKNAIEALNIDYKYGDTIEFVSTDSNKLNRVRIFGDVIKNTNNKEENARETEQLPSEGDTSSSVSKNGYEDGFKTADQMQNTRFKLTTDGLEAIYNSAPEFIGLTDLKVIKGETPDFKSGVTVRDDIDNISIDEVTINSDGFNSNVVNVYGVTYTVTDSWGRTTSKVRNVRVVSKVENNIISLDGDNNNKLFEIGFDTVTNKLTFNKIELNSESGSDSTVGGGTEEQSPPGIEENNSFRVALNENTDNKVFEIKVFNEQMTQVGVATLNNDYNYEEFKEQLEKINMYESYYVSLWSKESNKLKINGSVNKDDSNITEENYADGINSKDQMINVRFESTEDGLRAVYNSAPVISMLTSSTSETQPQAINDSIPELTRFSHYLGETYKLTENMKVTDDKDTNISVEDITATYVKKVVSSENTTTPEPSEGSRTTLESGQETTEDSSGNNGTTETVKNPVPTEVGTYIVTYTVTDSWGRESKATRELTIKNGIERHEITFRGHERIGNTNNYNDITAFSLKFNHIENSDKVSISVVAKDRPISDRYVNNGGLENFYNIKVLDENGRVVKDITLNARDNPKRYDRLIELSREEFQYGYKIKIGAFQTPGLSILGEILGDVKEDYSDGVGNKMNVEYVTFELTKEGLKAKYVDSDLNNSIKNVITNLDFGGIQAFKINYDISDNGQNSQFIGKLHISDRGGQIKYEDRSHSLTIRLVRKNENTIEQRFIGTDNGNDNKFNSFNDKYVKEGDYIEFWAKAPDRLFITGNAIDKVNNHDYTLGGSKDLFANTRFYFTSQGIEPKYNKAPQITADAIDIYQGDTPFNFTDGVKVTDDHDDINEDGTLKENTNTPSVATANTTPTTNVLSYTITNKQNGDTDTEIDTSVLGERTVTYTYTDSWGRTGTTTRKVVVRPNLYKNRIKVYAEESDNLKARTASNTNENVGGDNSVGDSENSGDINQDSTVESNKKEPAFEIGFNTLTGKYEVLNKKDEYLDVRNPRKDIFSIQIKAADGRIKFSETLQGNDKGTTSKLNALNEVNYEATDIIRVWRAGTEEDSIPFRTSESNKPILVPNLKITGDIIKESNGDVNIDEDYSDGINNLDFMNNVGFKPENGGLKAIYNKAPEINGFNESDVKVVVKGTNLNLRDGISVNDDKDNPNTLNNFTVSPNTIDTSELGTHKITYTVTDSWNRTTRKVRTIKVVSKVENNAIEVYTPNEENSLLFKIDFDANNKKFIINGTISNNNQQNNSQDGQTENDLQESRTGETPPSTEDSSEESNEGKIFRIKIFDVNGNVVVNSSVANTEEITLESIKSQLENLINYTFNIGDSISIWSSNADKVKIKGNIRNNSKNYEDGLGSKMDEVRFKITENGLQEITATTPVITFDEGDNSVEVKRGGEISYLAGVSVSDESENVPISKVTYTVNSTGDNSNNNNIIDTSVLGEKTVTYKVTNSWGKTVTKVRKYNIVHKNEIDAVRLNFKSKNNENNYLELGFDEITKKLHVYKNPTEALYSEDSDNVLSISIYDSNGNTTETLQIVGNQVIPEEKVNRINNLPYTEGMYIGIETKYPEKLSITGNITHSDKQNQFYTNVDFSNGIQESEKDALENTRFKIGSTQIEAVYNEAPVINYPGKNDNSKNNGRIIVKKGEIYDYNKDLTVIDDHDGSIEATNVGVDESLVNYDQVGLYNITYIVTDSWGRDGTVTRPVQIVSNIVGNEINVYSRNTNENTSEGTGTEDEQIENINDENVGSSDGSSSEGSGESDSTGDSNGSNDSIGDSSNSSETTTQFKGRVFTIGFKEEVVSENNIKIKLEVRNKNDIAIDSSRENQVAIKIVAYNKEGKEISGKNLSLNGNITGNSQELNQLESWELEYGDYISLYASDLDEEVSGNNSQIVEDENVDMINMKSSESSTEGSNEPEDTTETPNTPNVPEVPEEPSKKEPVTSMLRITGGVVNAKEDYNSGKVKKDNIVNVRFEVTDWGLEALYNEAPIINIKEVESGLFSKYLGETYEITEGVTVYDEIDGEISADKIETSFKLISESVNNQGNGQQQEGSTRISDNNSSTDTNSSENDSENDDIDEGKGKPKKPGRYLLTYTVADSWGRKSSKTRNIEIKPGMERYKINFRGHNNREDRIAFKLKFTDDGNNEGVKISIIDAINAQISNRYNGDGFERFYTIKIFNESNSELKNIQLNTRDNPKNDPKLQELTQMNIKYGYKIQVLAFQTPGLSISGEILGDVFEDYSDGVQNRYNLDKVTFDITKEGLVAHYSDEEITSKSQNIIAVVDVGGLNPFRIKVVPRNSMSQQQSSSINSNAIGRLDVTTTGAQIIYQDKGETRDVLSIGLYRSTNSGQNIVKNFSSNSSTNNENGPNFNSFNNQLVYPGDYLEIRFKAPSTFYIMGDPHPNSNSKVDYREGAKDEDNLNNVRFYFKDNSENPEQPILMPVYNEAPEITGIDFRRVPVNTSYDLLQGVVTSDQIDDALNKKVKLVIKCTELGINKTVTQNANKVTSSSGIRSIFSRTTNSTNSNDSTTVFNKDTSNEGTIDDNLEIDMTAFNYKFDKSGIFNIEYTMTDSWGRTT